MSVNITKNLTVEYKDLPLIKVDYANGKKT